MKLRFTVEILLNESWWFMTSSFLLLSKCVFYRAEAILIFAKTKKLCHLFCQRGDTFSFKLIVSLQGVSQKIQPTRMNSMFGVEISFLKAHSKIENMILKFKHKELINLKKKVNLTWFISMVKLTTQSAVFVFEWYLRSLKVSSTSSSAHCADHNFSQLYGKSCITEF